MSRPILYLEPVGGVAGDMFLAAALDLGVSRDELVAALSGLSLSGWSLSTTRAVRHGISGTHLDVVVDGQAHHDAHRSLGEIRRLIEGAPTLSVRAKERALRAFEIIGHAEAKIHDASIDEIHFHEVGAVDSIVDICGAAVVLDLLGDPQTYAAPPPLGSGTVHAAHGPLPIPAPATLEILRDVPVRFEGKGELTTPTGAALLKAFARIGEPPPMVVERVGYGVGTRELLDRANVLRASLGHATVDAADATFVVEANLDDCSPQLLGALVEGLLVAGALDAYVVPVTMKKSRPGHLLGALVPASARDAVVKAILSETTTLGLRFHRVERVTLERRFVEVVTRYGPVRIKVGEREGRVFNAHPEFDDCRALAAKAGVSVKEVWAAALAAHHQS